jgi:hypothetical protein
MLKARFGAYDGRGNHKVNSQVRQHSSFRIPQLYCNACPSSIPCILTYYTGRDTALVASTAALTNTAYFILQQGDVEEAFQHLTGPTGVKLYAEKWCPFTKELAVMVARRCHLSIAQHRHISKTHSCSVIMHEDAVDNNYYNKQRTCSLLQLPSSISYLFVTQSRPCRELPRR